LWWWTRSDICRPLFFVLSTICEIPHLFLSWSVLVCVSLPCVFDGRANTPKFGSQNFCSCRLLILSCFHYLEKKIWRCLWEHLAVYVCVQTPDSRYSGPRRDGRYDI
jgi:hypothetical protein